MKQRWAQIAFLALPLVVFARVASAGAPRLAHLDYQREEGAERCPDAHGFSSAVATRLGYEPFDDAAAARLVIRVAPSATGLTGQVSFVDEYHAPRGERNVSSLGADCVELAASLALTSSMILDPRELAAPALAAPPIAPLPARPDPSPFAPESPDLRRSAPGRKESVHLRVGAGSIVSFGAAPSPALGVAAFVDLRYRTLSLAVEGRADFPASQDRGDGTGVRSSLLVGTLAPCKHLGWFAVCVLGTLGSLHGEAFNVGTPERHASFYAATGGRVIVEIPIGSFVFARAGVDGLIPLTRTTLSIRGAEVWTTPIVSGSLGLGLGGHFF